MMSDQTGFSSYTVLSSSDIARDEYNRPSKSDLSVAYNRLLAEKWRILYGEFLENEILSDKFSSFEDILFEIEGSHTPYCVMEFIEGVGWECYQDFMGGEEIYYSSLLDQPE